LLGADDPEIPEDEEGPVRKRKIKPFRIGETSVTNEQFARFVDETGYVTEADKLGWSYVFHLQVPKNNTDAKTVPGLGWWKAVKGACWKQVVGPGASEIGYLSDHPAVHISWHDANAFASWAGGRLPSEAEWEYTARGGLGDVRYPWGDEEPNDTNFTPCNIWQGRFPHENTAVDGYKWTAPAKSFEPNGYGLYNMSGNVWEWTSDIPRLKSLKRSAKLRMVGEKGWKLSKGGSFLCHRSYCFRYRIAARSTNSPDSSTSHLGFRVVWRA